MARRLLSTKLSLFLGVTTLLFCPTLQVAQQVGGSASLRPFVGNWQGICADGAEYIVLKLSQSGNEMVGTVSIANMSGPHGKCVSVTDPPTDQHAMKIHDVMLREKTLKFRGAGQTAFEMSVGGADEATLKFLGTPVENNPWTLKRMK